MFHMYHISLNQHPGHSFNFLGGRGCIFSYGGGCLFVGGWQIQGNVLLTVSCQIRFLKCARDFTFSIMSLYTFSYVIPDYVLQSSF